MSCSTQSRTMAGYNVPDVHPQLGFSELHETSYEQTWPVVTIIKKYGHSDHYWAGTITDRKLEHQPLDPGSYFSSATESMINMDTFKVGDTVVVWNNPANAGKQVNIYYPDELTRSWDSYVSRDHFDPYTASPVTKADVAFVRKVYEMNRTDRSILEVGDIGIIPGFYTDMTPNVVQPISETTFDKHLERMVRVVRRCLVKHNPLSKKMDVFWNTRPTYDDIAASTFAYIVTANTEGANAFLDKDVDIAYEEKDNLMAVLPHHINLLQRFHQCNEAPKMGDYITVTADHRIAVIEGVGYNGVRARFIGHDGKPEGTTLILSDGEYSCKSGGESPSVTWRSWYLNSMNQFS